MKRKGKPKTVAMGAPLNSTDEELDILALITPQDIEDAKAAGRQRMTKRGAALLEAARVDNGPLPVES